MTCLNEIITINAHSNDAAIVVQRSLSDHHLVESFAPTKAAVAVLKQLCEAFLPHATQEQRALNIHGSYGSGKSHLSVLIAQLLRDGSGDSAFQHFFDRLRNFGEPALADNLNNTFLAADDKNAKPYLLVSLYGSETPALGDKLMEGLYDAIKRHPSINSADILPTTEYDVCLKRFETMCSQSPEFVKADLSQWQLAEHYLTTEDMCDDLKNHQPMALELFKRWHQAVCHGQAFNPASEGGSNFIKAYVEAGKNLAEKYSFGGILVLWDEFGLALEELISNPYRNAVAEIFDLQHFVESACSPVQGHTLFIGLTHVSFTEYGQRMNCDATIKNRLEAIFGRFKAFKIELSVAESEGYHLLGMQKSWTEFGQQQFAQSKANQEKLISVCSALPLFKTLGQHLHEVSNETYPLHPVMAAGLFGLSAMAQATRTALTFFRDNKDAINARAISENGLFTDELIRLPELVDYYSEAIKKYNGHEWERYQRAAGKIPVNESQGKHDILKLLLLSEFLGENFQTNEAFLACALYDTERNSLAASTLNTDLNWLKAAALIWKNDATQQWTLLGDTGINVEKLIGEKLNYFAGRSLETLLNDHPEMKADLLPILGEHDLEPSLCGIVRSFQVSLLTPPFPNTLKLTNPLISGHVYLVLAKDAEEIVQVKARIQETARANLYFWLPTSGIRSESVSYEGKELKFSGLLCRYLAIELLLKEKTATDDLRRQLTAKWEKSRTDLQRLLHIFYGREGLTSGRSEILQAGATQAIDCKSWYEFKGVLAEKIQAEYLNEIPIRAMNMNGLNNESYTGKSKSQKIVERILEFDSNLSYQTDLLGERNDTSETSALIDGVLGANNLFIQREPKRWDIKRVDETEEGIKDVLMLLFDTLTRTREKTYSVVDLRKKLVSPPYGIPACNIAILAAVAIRHDVNRLRWGSCGTETDFAVNLNNAFVADSKLTIRLHDFSSKQLKVLQAVNEYFELTREPDQTDADFAGQAVAKLREFIVHKPDVIKQSPQLNQATKELVKIFNAVGKTQQEIADKLLDSFGTENTGHALKIALDDFARIEDAKRHEINQSWKEFLTKIVQDKENLILRLTHERASDFAKKVGGLLERDHVSPDDLTSALLNQAVEKCEEREIHRCLGQLDSLVDYHPPQSPPEPVPPIDPPQINETRKGEANPTDVVAILRQHISALNLPTDTVKQALVELLRDYEA